MGGGDCRAAVAVGCKVRMGEIDPQRVNYKRKHLHYPNYSTTKLNMPTNQDQRFPESN